VKPASWNATRQALLDLALSSLAFTVFAFLTVRNPEAKPLALFSAEACAIAFWWGVQWGTPALPAREILRPLVIGTGLVLLTESLIAYVQLNPLPFGALLGGGLTAAALTTTIRARLISRWSRQGALLLGYDPLDLITAAALAPRLLGAIEKKSSRLPTGISYLGDYASLANQVHTHQPALMVACSKDWEECVSPRFLLECKLGGTVMKTAASVQEDFLERIPVENLNPFHFLWSESFRGNRRTMAVQAVYSNLIGLVLLVAAAPFLVVMGLVARLAAGPGPVFEKIECAGFQGIPFFRRRFRVKRAGTNQWTVIGRLLTRLRLTGLPQLINLVRGEMALFGPQAIRIPFAEYLDNLSPLYSRRLLVKPGIFGWAQANGGRDLASPGSFAIHLQEENLRIAYDLYYLQFGSPLMDFEILNRTLLGPKHAPKRR